MPVSLEQFGNKKNLIFLSGLLVDVAFQKQVDLLIRKQDSKTMLNSHARFESSAAFVFASLVFALCILSKSVHSIDDGWKSKPELQKLISDRFEDPKEGKPLHRENRIWINRDEQFVILDGYVVQRNVPLELFACPAETKDHESIVAVFSRAQLVHAGLLAISAQPGSTATFEPFKPAHGTTIRVYVLWLDDEGKTKGTLAQNWIRKSGTKTSMVWDWVFAGSKIYKDDEGKEHYLGDSGELISVSNFVTSTMDVAVQSEQSNSSLVFEAFTERIPPKFTPVRLVLTLSDESPFSGPEQQSEEPTKKEIAERKHLTAPVSENILKMLVGKPVEPSVDKSADATPTEVKSTKPPPAINKK